MKKVQLKTYLILILFAAVLFGCKKEDDDTDAIQEPNLQTEIVEPPESMINSQDVGAQQSVAFINMANAFAGFAGTMVPPESKHKSGMDDGPPWIYTWTVNDYTGSYTVTLTVDEKGNDGFEWEMKINGTMDGLTLNNFVYMHAEQSEDGTEGIFEMFDPETQELGMYVAWVNTATVYNLIFEVPEEMKIEINDYPDESGNLEVLEWENGAYILVFESEWTATNGSWWTYIDGELYDSGSW